MVLERVNELKSSGECLEEKERKTVVVLGRMHP